MEAKSPLREFRIIINDSELQGVYHGTRPNQAALKAFNWYCRRNNVVDTTVDFVLLENTKEHKGKKYNYVGVRKLLDTPKEIVRTGKSIIIRHLTTVHRSKADAATDSPNAVEAPKEAVAEAPKEVSPKAKAPRAKKAKAAAAEAVAEAPKEAPKEEVKEVVAEVKAAEVAVEAPKEVKAAKGKKAAAKAK